MAIKFRPVSNAEQAVEAIEDGKLLWNYESKKIWWDRSTTRLEMYPTDTALSTTSTNPIQNQALTNSIINTTAEVSAITTSNVPCGTLPVKELITNLTANSNSFIFAYDSASASYGYKAGGADTFHPFSELYVKKIGCTSIYVNGASIGSMTLDCSKYAKLKIGSMTTSGSLNYMDWRITGYTGTTPTSIYNSSTPLANVEYDISAYDTVELWVNVKGANTSTYGGAWFNDIYLK